MSEVISLLSTEFRKKVGKSKDQRMKSEAVAGVSYPTGFLSYDFLNGTVVHTKSEILPKYNSIGVLDGSVNIVIGRAGCGKSTFVEQCAANIVRPFNNSSIFVEHVEATGMSDVRRQTITGITGDEYIDRYIIRDSGVTAENFYERIKLIYDIKIEKKEEYLYDTGLIDTLGRRIEKLQPTVLILDSLAMIMPEKFTDEDELSGQMSATAGAKALASIFKRIIPLLKAANIIVFVVNHITQKVEINQFKRTKAQLSYLKPDEALPGGVTPVYLATNVIRLDDGTKLKDSEGLGINGSIVDLTIVKSRTAAVGRSVPLVYTFDHGFDYNLSLYVLLKDKGRINGAGAYLYIGNHDEYKFAQKNFLKLLNTDEMFRDIFISEVFDLLSNEIITNDQKYEENSYDHFGVTNTIINNMILGNIA